MYLFINEHTIEKYNGEVLKRYVGNRLVKVIANPTDDDLREFGYKSLNDTEKRLDDKENFYIEEFYSDGDIIDRHYRYVPDITE